MGLPLYCCPRQGGKSEDSVQWNKISLRQDQSRCYFAQSLVFGTYDVYDWLTSLLSVDSKVRQDRKEDTSFDLNFTKCCNGWFQ